MMARVVKEALILCAACSMIGILANVVLPTRIPWIGHWDEHDGIGHPGGRCCPETEIGQFEEILREYESWETVFVDARALELYHDGHIPGAVSLPVESASDQLSEFMAFHPPDKRLVIYCSGEGCYDSHDLADLLATHGYFNVMVYIGGYADWIDRNQPIRTGKDP